MWHVGLPTVCHAAARAKSHCPIQQAGLCHTVQCDRQDCWQSAAWSTRGLQAAQGSAAYAGRFQQPGKQQVRRQGCLLVLGCSTGQQAHTVHVWQCSMHQVQQAENQINEAIMRRLH